MRSSAGGGGGGGGGKFDVVKLQRRDKSKRFYPTYQLLPAYSLGRLRYHDYGGEGYVITRRAAAHLLSFPRTLWEIDELISRFWDVGLSQVLYLNPPVVFHDEIYPSYIESVRRHVWRAHRRRRRRNPLVMGRGMMAGLSRAARRWMQLRELRKQDREIDPYSF